MSSCARGFAAVSFELVCKHTVPLSSSALRCVVVVPPAVDVLVHGRRVLFSSLSFVRRDVFPFRSVVVLLGPLGTVSPGESVDFPAQLSRAVRTCSWRASWRASWGKAYTTAMVFTVEVYLTVFLLFYFLLSCFVAVRCRVSVRGFGKQSASALRSFCSRSM